MCGIAGYLDMRHGKKLPAGAAMLKMLTALGCRGPDSAGVAVFGAAAKGELVARVKLGDGAPTAARLSAVKKAASRAARVKSAVLDEELARLTLVPNSSSDAVVRAIEGVAPDVEVVSLGHRLEILKQVGAPAALEASYAISKLAGSHALGHTRLSTESAIDLSHSQPFWAHGRPDLATVHNGHITNYHRLRTIYEERGVRFYTHNDSELIGVYLADRLASGDSLEAAMEGSFSVLDGSYSYLVATADSLGYVKDRFAFKPLIVAESDGVVAIATEEVAIQAVLPRAKLAVEPAARTVRVWKA